MSRDLDDFVRDNLGLAYAVANRHAARASRFGVELDDLRQVAAMALFECAKRRDNVRGAFSTYATTAIERAVHAYLEQEAAVAGWERDVPDVADETATAAPAEARLAVAAFLDVLPERHAQVLAMLYGIGGQPMTSAEVSALLGVSDARVRQIHAEALDMCRASCAAD